MYKSIKNNNKLIIIVVSSISWVLFILFTYSLNTVFHFMPLIVLFFQLIMFIILRSKKSILILLLNPVIICCAYYSSKSIVNYINEKPTLIYCTYHLPSVPRFDNNKNVNLEYFDDDCDWEGLYYYTSCINNKITNYLLKSFGNPLDKKKNTF